MSQNKTYECLTFDAITFKLNPNNIINQSRLYFQIDIKNNVLLDNYSLMVGSIVTKSRKQFKYCFLYISELFAKGQNMHS